MPNKKTSLGDVYVYIAIIAIMLLLMGNALTMSALQTKLLPLAIGSIAVLLAALGLWGELTGRAKKSSGGGEEGKAQGWHKPLMNLSWIMGFLVAIHFVGFLTAIVIFVFSYMVWLGVTWRQALIFTILTPAVIYGLFSILLKVDFYKGILFDLFS